jgi:hypothetical protein
MLTYAGDYTDISRNPPRSSLAPAAMQASWLGVNI